jgi:ankyrin repeat protein
MLGLVETDMESTEVVAIVKYFHFAGLDVRLHKESANWLSAFCHNWDQNDVGDVIDFFAEQGADLCKPDDNGRTPLHAAWINHGDGADAMDGDSQVIARLCSHSPAIYALAAKYSAVRWHGLHLACFLGDYDSVQTEFSVTGREEKILLDYMHQCDTQGRTCCHLAAGTGSIPTLELLKQQGADLSIGIGHISHTHYSDTSTPYHEACQNHHLECMRYLQDNGHGDSPGSYRALRLAFFCGHLDIFQYLVGLDSTLLHCSDDRISSLLRANVADRFGESEKRSAGRFNKVGTELCAQWLSGTREAKRNEEQSETKAAMAAAEEKARAIAQALIEEENQEKAKATAKSEKRKQKKKQANKQRGKRQEQQHVQKEENTIGTPERASLAMQPQPPTIEPSPLERAAENQDFQLESARQRDQDSSQRRGEEENRNLAKAESIDKRLEQAMQTKDEDMLRACIEWAKGEAKEQGFCLKKLKLLKLAKRQLKVFVPAPAQAPAEAAAPAQAPTSAAPAAAPVPVSVPAPTFTPASAPGPVVSPLVNSASEAEGLRKLVSQLLTKLDEQQSLHQQEVQQQLQEQKQRNDQNTQQAQEQHQRELSAFQAQTGEPEQIQALTQALEKAEERIEDLESEYETLNALFQPVQAENEKRKTMLTQMRKLAVALSQRRQDLELPTKRMGEVDSAKLHKLGVSVEEISSLQQLVTNVSWHPWRMVPKKGQGRGEMEVVQVANWDEPQLAAIVRKYDAGRDSERGNATGGSSGSGSTGEQVAEEVLRCSKELGEWNPSGSYCVTIPYHHGQQRELRPDELLKIVARMKVDSCRLQPRSTAGAHHMPRRIDRRQVSVDGAGTGATGFSETHALQVGLWVLGRGSFDWGGSGLSKSGLQLFIVNGEAKLRRRTWVHTANLTPPPGVPGPLILDPPVLAAPLPLPQTWT